MEESTFFVNTGRQSAILNKLFRAADLAHGVVIRNGEGFEITIQWKEGVVVDEARIKKVRAAIKEAYESEGTCVLGIYLI